MSINTDSILSGDLVLQRAKTTSHYHTDPKLIEQIGCKTMLRSGMLVYLDKDGYYKPAIALCQRSCNIIGVVISFVGEDKFYLKHNHGHMYYREPLPPDWFFTIDGKVDEFAPLFEKIPNTLGNPVYLSDTVPGGMMSSPPINNKYVVQAGYRTEYGFYFKPEPFCCDTLSFASYDPEGCVGLPPPPPDGGSSSSAGCVLGSASSLTVSINTFCGIGGVFVLPVGGPFSNLQIGVNLYKNPNNTFLITSVIGLNGNAGYAKFTSDIVCALNINSRMYLSDYNSAICTPSDVLTNSFAQILSFS
jgi:hypothetical protein